MRFGLEGHRHSVQTPLVENGQQGKDVGLIHALEFRPGLFCKFLAIPFVAAWAAKSFHPAWKMLVQKLGVPLETACGQNDAAPRVYFIAALADSNLDAFNPGLLIEDQFHDPAFERKLAATIEAASEEPDNQC